MKKLVIGSILVFILLFSLFNVAVLAVNNDIKGEIEIWSWNIAAKGLEDIVPGFNEVYPNVKVNIKSMDTESLYQKLIMSTTSGVGGADIVSIQGRNVKQFAGKALMDVTDLANEYKNNFVSFKWAEVSENKKIYALPWDIGPVGVFYRRDIFDKYNINPEEINTWDDFIKAGKKIVSESNGDVHMISVADSSGSFQFHQMITKQLKSGIFNKKGEIIVNNQENIKALKLIKRMVDSGIAIKMEEWTPSWYANMKTGAVATYVNGVWLGGTLQDQAPDTAGKWGVFRMPAVEAGGLRASNSGGSALAVTEVSDNKKAAAAFLEYAMATKEAQLKMYDNRNLFPAYKPAYNSDLFNEPVEFFGGQKVRRFFADVAVKISDYYYNEDYQTARNLLDSAIYKHISGQKSAEKSLNDLAKRIGNKTDRKIAQ